MTRVKGFCCNYTIGVDVDALVKEGMVPKGLEIERLPCSGRLEVEQLLDAFTQGADAVFVVGCEPETCHNLTGSRRAAKRVLACKKIISELGMDQGLVEMFFAGRGETEPVIKAARTMAERVSAGHDKGD